MANERRIRLIQVAKEFNVGINTITDFLQKKGVKSDGSPNALVDAETYALLEKEFGAGRAVNSERVNIRERIAQKQATVTLDDDAKGKGGKNDEELLVKSCLLYTSVEHRLLRLHESDGLLDQNAQMERRRARRIRSGRRLAERRRADALHRGRCGDAFDRLRAQHLERFHRLVVSARCALQQCSGGG